MRNSADRTSSSNSRCDGDSMTLSLRGYFFYEVEAERAVPRRHELTKMLVRARLLGAPAKLQHVLRRRRLIDVEFLPCPCCHCGDGRRGRETLMLRLAHEIHLDHDVPTPMYVHVAAMFKVKLVERFRHVDRFVLIDTILNIFGLPQSFVPLSDEHQNVRGFRSGGAHPNKHLHENVR